MKYYFRLLFVSSVLFILLGLHEGHSGNTDRSQPAGVNTGAGTFQEGILPGFSADRPEPLLLAGALMAPGRDRELQKQREEITSAGNRILFQWISDRFMRYRPGIMNMTGYFLCFPAGKNDPPLS
jgi:hypothetical protein